METQNGINSDATLDCMISQGAQFPAEICKYMDALHWQSTGCSYFGQFSLFPSLQLGLEISKSSLISNHLEISKSGHSSNEYLQELIKKISKVLGKNMSRERALNFGK